MGIIPKIKFGSGSIFSRNDFLGHSCLKIKIIKIIPPLPHPRDLPLTKGEKKRGYFYIY